MKRNLLLVVVLHYFVHAAQAQYTYTTNNGTITITGYTGTNLDVVIPSTIDGLPVTSIGTNAFQNSVTKLVGSDFFYFSQNLISVTIPNGVTNIGDGAFSQCQSLSNVTIPNTVTSIGDYAFLGTGLTSVTIPTSVTSIGDSAFESCESLTNIMIPNSVMSIGAEAFAFSGLIDITVDAANPNYSSVGGVLFDKGQTTLIQYPKDKAEASFTIPKSVTSIGDYAFEYCENLTNVMIPNSVTSIGNHAFENFQFLTSLTIPNSVTSIGDYAFGSCRLSSITIPSSVTSIGNFVFFECGILSAITVDSANPNYSSVGGVLFDKAQRRLMQYPSSKAGTSYIIPNSVTNIGDSAFNRCHNLTSVTIPNSVTSIGDEAFTQCQSLSNVTIPNSVTSIGVGAFSGCVSLTSVTIGSSLTNIGDSAFGDCWSLTAITVDSANPNYSSVGGVLFDKGQTTLMQYPYAKAGASYTIPNSVTNIADSAFSGCQSLTSLTIPNSVTSIGNYTFSECTSLTSITIPNGVNSIGDSAFYFCYSLTNVTIPASVTSIGHSAFSDCYGLHSVTIPNSVTSIGDGAFYDCDSLTTVFFRGNAPTVGVLAFVKDDSYGIFYEPPVTNYYLPGTTGWRKNYGGARTAIWTLPYPLVLSGSVGVQTNGFAFTVSWATNAFVVVEASTDLKNPSWSPVQTNALNNGVVNFTDPQWAKSPSRFCRVRSQ